MNTYDLLENCIQIERNVGQIYSIFMDQQSSCPEYAQLWEKTAQEENNHEQQFILAKRLACCMKTDTTDSAQPSNELVKKLVALKVRVAEIPLSPSESLRLAIDMEEKLAAFHMSQMHIFSDESTNNLFKSMMNNDNDHLKALKKAFDLLL
jgi:rubrerythrin